ncbi:MAG: energy transducer TonB [Parvibaculaceae bacterium]|nr:energy transducer TonB [Parvibaculaceae bacterium]
MSITDKSTPALPFKLGPAEHFIPFEEPGFKGKRAVIALLIAFLVHMILFGILILWKPKTPKLAEPPKAISVQLVPEPEPNRPRPKPQQPKPQPKPEEKKPAPKPVPQEQKKPEPEKKPETPPELKYQESGGSPKLKPGRVTEVKKDHPRPPATAQEQKPQVQKTPQEQSRKVEPNADKGEAFKKAEKPSEKSSRGKKTQTPSSAPTAPLNAPPAPGTPALEEGEAQMQSPIAGQGGGDAYLNEIRDMVMQSIVYPSATARGADGVVTCGMTITRQGWMINVRVLQSSGNAALDRAAMDAIRNAGPFPPLPDNIPGNQVGIIATMRIGPDGNQ